MTASALAVLRSLLDDGWIENASLVGDYFKQKLMGLKQKYTIVKDVRGLGLILGLELNVEGAPIVAACMQRGFLINCIQEKVLRFVPPLIIRREEVDSLIDCLDAVFEETVT